MDKPKCAICGDSEHELYTVPDTNGGPGTPLCGPCLIGVTIP